MFWRMLVVTREVMTTRQLDHRDHLVYNWLILVYKVDSWSRTVAIASGERTHVPGHGITLGKARRTWQFRIWDLNHCQIPNITDTPQMLCPSDWVDKSALSSGIPQMPGVLRSCLIPHLKMKCRIRLQSFVLQRLLHAFETASSIIVVSCRMRVWNTNSHCTPKESVRRSLTPSSIASSTTPYSPNCNQSAHLSNHFEWRLS